MSEVVGKMQAHGRDGGGQMAAPVPEITYGSGVFLIM
jgi:hypothetical protein